MANEITGASLSPIYQRLNDAPEYHPLGADTFSDWSLEAGDIVTVSREGKEYKSPVHSSRMVWKGGAPTVTLNATGNEKRSTIAKAAKKKFMRSGLRNSENAFKSIITSYNEMTAGLELASSSAALYVENRYKQMKAGLDLTSSSASLYVDSKYNQMKAGLDLTSNSAALYVENRYKQMKAGLDLSSSSAALYVENRYKQMKAGLDLSSSSAALYVENRYKQMKAGLDLTSSSASLYVDNKYDQMKAGLDLTSSSASLYVDNKYDQMKAGLDLTSSSASLYVDNKYDQMKAGLDLTSSSASLYVDNKYDQLKAGLDITSSSASLYVDNKYDQLKAGLDLTSSSASLYVDNKYDQLKAGLDLTSSSASLYVDNKYDQLKAGLDLTSSTAALYVRDTAAGLEGKIYVEAGKAGLVTSLTDSRTVLSFPKYDYFPRTGSTDYLYLDLDTKNYWEWNGSSYQRAAGPGATINASAITTSINEAGESEAHIDSDKVYIGNDKSTTVVSGKMNTNQFTAQNIQSKLNELGIVHAASLNVDGGIKLGNEKYGITTFGVGTLATLEVARINLNGYTSFQDVLIDASVSGGTLTLTKASGGTVTFSRATSLSGVWSGTQYTVTASPQGNTDSILVSYRSNAHQNEYFFEGVYMRPGDSQWTPIPQSSLDYKMALNGITNGSSVILVRNDGSALPNTWLTPGFPITITVPNLEIYTSDRVPSGSTNLSTLRNNFYQAKEDSDYVIFKVNASGVTRTFYMEP